MNTFFRKHAKIIMGLVSIVLMFVFAMPGVKQPSTYEKESAAVGSLQGKKVTNADVGLAEDELGKMRTLGLMDSWVGRLVQQVKDDKDRARYWIMLKTEARKYEASTFSPQEARSQATSMQMSATNLNNVELADVLSDYYTVQEYIDFLIRQPAPSSALELEADKQLRKAQLSFLTLDAQKQWEEMAEPTSAQVEAQFKTYKGVVHTVVPAPGVVATVPPEKDGHHYPFGYKYPDQVEVEYATFEWPAIEKLVTAKDDADAKYKDKTSAFEQFQKELRENPDKFKGKKWEDLSAQFIKAQADARVQQRIKLMTESFLDHARKTEEAGGRVVYADLAKDLAATSEFVGYEAPVKAIPLRSAEDLAKVEGVGGSYYRDTSRYRDNPFPTVALNLQELLPDAQDKIGQLKVGMEGPPTVDAAKNTYIFRVTKAVASHEPASLDEGDIRQQVTNDLKKLERYLRNVEQMKSLVKVGGDLDAVAAADKLPIAKTPEITRLTIDAFQDLASPNLETTLMVTLSGGQRPMDDDLKAAADDYIKMQKGLVNFDALSESMAIPGFTDAAFAVVDQSTGSDKRCGPLESEATLRCYVLQVQKVTPATGQDFKDARQSLYQKRMQNGLSFVTNYLNQAGLESRLKWRPK